MIFIGIDNGVTGSVGIIDHSNASYLKMPIRKVLNYTKKKQFLNRIDAYILSKLIINLGDDHANLGECHAMIERPMINPMRWKASMSAIRALEATQTIIESCRRPISLEFIDSKEWQKELLPKGLEKEELKFASLEVGKRLFPSVDFSWAKDADGLLIAEYCRRTLTRRGSNNG